MIRKVGVEVELKVETSFWLEVSRLPGDHSSERLPLSECHSYGTEPIPDFSFGVAPKHWADCFEVGRTSLSREQVGCGKWLSLSVFSTSVEMFIQYGRWNLFSEFISISSRWRGNSRWPGEGISLDLISGLPIIRKQQTFPNSSLVWWSWPPFLSIPNQAFLNCWINEYESTKQALVIDWVPIWST